MNTIKKCNKCSLCNNQLPLLDNKTEADIMWIGLSAKKVDDICKNTPLANDTNSGKIIERIENKLPNYKFYKTNLVKCLPLDAKNKLRYPTMDEMDACLDNLLCEIKIIKPKLVFALGKKTYNFLKNKIDNVIYIEHPSYIYVYKRKYIDEYINKVINIISSQI